MDRVITREREPVTPGGALGRICLASRNHSLLMGWLKSMPSAFLACKSPRRAGPAVDVLGNFSADALKDIGLSRSDLPAVGSGLYFADSTRRKR